MKHTIASVHWALLAKSANDDEHVSHPIVITNMAAVWEIRSAPVGRMQMATSIVHTVIRLPIVPLLLISAIMVANV